MRGKRIKIALKGRHHRLVSKTQTVFHRRGDDGPTLIADLVALCVFRGSGPVLLRNPIFCDFREMGSGPPAHPSGSAHVLVHIAYAQAPPLNATADVSSGATCQESLFCLYLSRNHNLWTQVATMLVYYLVSILCQYLFPCFVLK